MSKTVWAEITVNREIASGIFLLELTTPADCEPPVPGQFVNLYLNDPSRLLPRPISVCGFKNGCLTLVYAVVGSGTKLLSQYPEGTRIKISTPLGNGYKLDATQSFVLVGGGVGAPPLLFAAREIIKTPGSTVKAVLGFRSEVFLADEFPCPVEVATDDGSAGFHGNAAELLRRCEIPADALLLACGPRPMLKVVADFAKDRGLPLQVSLEERMGCGYGACVGCVCETVNGHRKVCEDGPVFNANEVLWNG